MKATLPWMDKHHLRAHHPLLPNAGQPAPPLSQHCEQTNYKKESDTCPKLHITGCGTKGRKKCEPVNRIPKPNVTLGA